MSSLSACLVRWKSGKRENRKNFDLNVFFPIKLIDFSIRL